MLLNGTYCYIINNLKKAGLLDKNYKEICCVCLILKRFGLLYLRDKLLSFNYEEENDCFGMGFHYNRKVNDLFWEGGVMNIKVYDWSKIEFFE